MSLYRNPPTMAVMAGAHLRAEWAKINIPFVNWLQSSNAFFEVFVIGAKDAAARLGDRVRRR